jgi:subfamily B ATP-binding cassette protein MsbA
MCHAVLLVIYAGMRYSNIFLKSGKKMAKVNSWQLYKRLLRYVLPFWPAFLAGILGSIVYSVVDAWLVHFMTPLLNKGFIQQDAHFIHWLPLMVIAIFVVRGGANIASDYFMTSVSRSVVRSFRQKIFQHYQRMPAQVYDNSSAGNLLSTITYNVEQIANASSDALTTFLQSFVLVVGLLVVMFTISWQLSLIYFAAIPVIVLVVSLFSRRTRQLSLSIQTSMGLTTAIAEENISAYKVVRTFGGQAYESQRFAAAIKTNLRRELKVAMAKALSTSGVQLVAAIALACIIFAATSNKVHLTAGAFTSLIASMLAILKPMRDITNVNNKIQRGLAGAQAIFSVLDAPLEVNVGKESVCGVESIIEFKQVNFKYHASSELILNQVSFEVKPKEIVAIVGRSGSGKTSLVNLLMRFYPADQHQVFLGGKDINTYELTEFRQYFAYVGQHVVLFNDTVANNIAYGPLREIVSRDDIIQAAKMAHAIEFIETLPLGFDTVIGDNGSLLSGGQRQRLALARAILKKAPILILDEATSALDTESERYIQDALSALMHQCTTLVIAHRLSTIKEANKIIVMDKGSVVEIGRHEELLALRGYYSRLYEMQFSHEIN